MGGVDKGLVAFHEKPLIAHAIERFAPQVSAVILNVNRSQAAYAAFNFPLVSDELSGFAGPLAGLAAGMHYLNTHCLAQSSDWVATVPCDSPFLPLDLVAKLAASANEHHSAVAVARTASGAQPVFALYQIGLLSNLQSFFATGKRQIVMLTTPQDAIFVDFFQENAFANINTVAELRLY